MAVNPWIVKHCFYPIHERLLGRSSLASLRQLEKSQWLTPAELHRLQQAKLRDLLTHANRHCPFYRQRLADAQIVPELARVEDLIRLPLLTKADIRRYGPLFTWLDAPGGVHRYTTGGSTGEPLVFFFDRRRQAYDQAARVRSHRWFGADLGDREVYMWGSPLELNRQNRARALRDRLTNHLLLSAFAMSPTRMDAYLESIQRYDPVSIFGYPSSLALLVSRARATGRTLHLPHLRAVFVTGETLMPADRAELEDYFGVPVANGYGSREGGFIAHECPHGRLHVTDENLIIEIIDSRARPVAPSELGRLVITHLDTYAMPFIRYLTGDLARRAADQTLCPCGRGLSTIESVEGRQTDFLVARDGTIRHALSAIYVLRECDRIERYRITQDADLAVHVDVVCREPLADSLLQHLHDGLAAALGHDLSITINQVENIRPAPSGKLRPVISHVQPVAALTP
ncbi:MAG: phenylacetate--CoA ligase family protein [Phycisphaerales bacterium]|nr:MAG: phenylacetate--CoA ligase family protein [Phycisphaerales bacterium]